MPDASIIAWLALLAWVPIAVLLFVTCRPAKAATFALLGACVLLPAGWAIDLSGFPEIDRHVVGGLALFVGYLLVAKPHQRARPLMGWPEWLVIVQVLCVLLSVMTNTDALRYGNVELPGLTPYESLTAMFRRLLTIGVPFLIGTRLVRSDTDLHEVLRAIAIVGLAYVAIVLWESRMSPQLHTQVYGYFPHAFGQHKRGDGFRPLGLTMHGLELALFMATATLAMFGLARAAQGRHRNTRLLLSACMLAGLVLCRSLGALLLGLLGIGLLVLKRFPGTTVIVLSCLIVAYPFLRANDLFPTAAMVQAASAIDEERAASLAFRFENEDILLAKARERLAFGWGTWGRNRVYNDETGKDESVVDGYWVIEIGRYGLVGFHSLFALLLLPVVLACRRLPAMRGTERVVVGTAVVLVLVRTLDFIPNAYPTPLTFFLAGTLVPFARLPAR